MFQRWPKQDPNKHYYLVPNEVFKATPHKEKI